MWGGLLSRESYNLAEAEAVDTVEGDMCGAATRDADALPRSKTPSRTKGTRRNLGDLAWPAVALAIPGRGRKSRRRSCRGTGEESDGRIVPMKPRTKPGDAGGGEGGGKAAGRREGKQRRMLRTQCRASHGIEAASRRIGGVQTHRSRSIFDRSPVRESRTPGSVRGALSNERPYRVP